MRIGKVACPRAATGHVCVDPGPDGPAGHVDVCDQCAPLVVEWLTRVTGRQARWEQLAAAAGDQPRWP